MLDKEKSLGFFVLMSVALGVLALLNSIIFAGSAASTIIGLVLNIIGVILLVWAGRSSKMVGGHPVGRGALMGAIYGIVFGISAFFMQNISAEYFGNVGQMPADQAQMAADMINSTGMHVFVLIFFIIIFSLLGLIISAIGGSTIKKPRN